MANMRLFILSAALIGSVVTGCSSAVESHQPKTTMTTAPTTSATASTALAGKYALTLQLGQAQTIPQQALRIEMTEVNDSRCPVGATCIRAGIAAVTVTVKGLDAGAVASSVMLDTSAAKDVTLNQAGVARTFRLSLQTLQPLATVQAAVAPDAYRASVVIEAP